MHLAGLAALERGRLKIGNAHAGTSLRGQGGTGSLLAELETPPLPHCPEVPGDARAHSERTIERVAALSFPRADKPP